MPNLDRQYLRIAAIWAENSYAKRLKVGVVIMKDRTIISDGYNGTPSGFENVCEDEHGKTFPYVLHAEANAITKLAQSNNSSKGATMYSLVAPCLGCAKLIIQSGIIKVIYAQEHKTDGLELLTKAGIKIEYLKL